jgi:folate-binding protein YgfZ
MAGWPRLGIEIDAKTLPQEVRFDELEGVSYTKGCYTGQETVARVHFRGHPNRRLVGFSWDDAPNPASDEVYDIDKIVGRVTTAAWIDDDLGYLGLGLVKQSVPFGTDLVAADSPATVTDLPFSRESESLVG